MHEPRQRATTLLKLGVSDINVAKYWSRGQFPLNALRWEISDLGGGARDVCGCSSFVLSAFFAYVELLCVFLILWREILECSPYLMPMDSASMCSDMLYLEDRWGKQWGGCQPQPWLNHIIWLPKWPRTPKSEPSSVDIIVWGYCHMPMDSKSMCSDTL